MATRGSTAISQEAVPQALILSVGPNGDTVSETDENGLLTLGTFPLECIPRLAPLALALTHLGLRHKPVVVKHRQGSKTPLLHVSHAKCRLDSPAQLSILRYLFRLVDFTSCDLELPVFSARRLPRIKALDLSTELTLRGEFTSCIHFLSVLDAERLRKIVIQFRRNQFEDLCAGTNVDSAYLLQLHSFAYVHLRAVKLCENEQYPRYSNVALACILRPLFSLQRLEDVELVLTQSPLSVRDYDITQIAYAWRDARRLVFSVTRCTKEAPTLDCLYVLADQCRSLEELLLPKLDVLDLGRTISKRPPAVPPAGTPTHPLRKFGVACDSRTNISDQRAGRISHCVDSLFPNINVKESWVHDHSDETILGDWYLIWVNLIATKAFRAVVPSRVTAVLGRPSDTSRLVFRVRY
ncbi:hypothetical protein PYCCODRAFT_1467969 [Trametes coccinea BRFM310]|uniref:F-box domain-containing protein n=1 Tax=Trametes coccinea (strain BRFM310) TaxID=1353009 RepID=A0A1Y2IMI6_TRAC3|nr:hypothetical protein PYCCODRAFT_1467969 [Trametes coccinea BRFM310]